MSNGQTVIAVLINPRSALCRFVPALLVLCAAPASAFDTNSWPGEGVPLLVASTDRLRLHARPDASAPRRMIPYRSGWRVPFTDSVQRTIASSAVTLVGSAELSVHCDGAPRAHRFGAGETVEYLQDTAEGHALVRLGDDVCEVPLHLESATFGTSFATPTVDWWVRVQWRDGSSPGWLHVDGTQTRVADRVF